ncbi:MAG: hypothetical protein J0L95_10550, partial [Candidatus Accumulibacter sp.]|uniref:hypothetical protein n=1 Tax=Accumulibacter sp. TaxID=2053492 RepID=UPI001AC2A373
TSAAADSPSPAAFALRQPPPSRPRQRSTFKPANLNQIHVGADRRASLPGFPVLASGVGD